MTNTELKYRQRYVDLIVNDDSRRNFVIRSKFVSYVRRFLDNRGYMEVETPVLTPFQAVLPRVPLSRTTTPLI